MPSFSSIDTTPIQSSGQEIISKTAIGLVMGGLLAALMFIILTLIGDTITRAVDSSTLFVGNPLFPLLLLMVVFVIVFVGNTIIALLFSTLYHKQYSSMGKWIRGIFITNVILFLIMSPIYIMFNDNLDTIFFVVGLHVIFAAYISLLQGDIIINPHYSLSHIIGASLGVGLSFLLFAIIFKVSGLATATDKIYMFLLFPPILAYTCIPFASCVRQMIYYKMYEGGSDMLYTPSPSDLLQLHEEGSNESDQNDEEVIIDEIIQ